MKLQSIGGKARMAGLTEDDRREIARQAGIKGAAARTANTTPEQRRAWGKKGGDTTKARHGTAHYRRIAKAALDPEITVQRPREYYQALARKRWDKSPSD